MSFHPVVLFIKACPVFNVVDNCWQLVVWLLSCFSMVTVDLVWLSGWVVRESPMWSARHGFKSWPPRCRVQPRASCLHTCASVTKQYNLVPANRQYCSAAGEVTTGLAESNGSLSPDLWLRSPAGWPPRTGSSSRTPCSFWPLDYCYLYCRLGWVPQGRPLGLLEPANTGLPVPDARPDA